MIKLEMLRVFRVTAEKGSLGSAADALGRTPSAVSMVLSQLEDDIGAPLFESDRKNRLTALGKLVLEESRRATDTFARSVDAINRHARSTAGTVRIAAVPSATVTLLPDVVAKFQRVSPAVRLEISDADSAEVRRRVDADEADIGILSTGVAESGGGTVILRDGLGIFSRQGGPISQAIAAGSPPSWQLLALEPLISNPLCALVDHDILPTLLADCNLESRNTTALLAFVRGGLGATILPKSAYQGWDDSLFFCAPENPKASRNLRKICADIRHLSPAGTAFWNALT